MNLLSKICWIGAVLYAVAGMVFGIVMSASGDHSLSPAHAHLILLGWVTLALYGTFYTLCAEATKTWVARIQVALAHLGVLVLTPGIVLAIQGRSETPAKVGAVIVLMSMLLFATVVFTQPTRSAKSA
ncbi:hypothetical protein AU381_19020 [Sinorhizobium glycinis]|uniref:Uncharacterized protein n=2 Tax=Sinorhizobium glycinis TaxID=1472378 RepID=A0A178XP23_9HYPH|nr:hypothetical protein AU381_19020 [Sinorhizobium glycinis]